MKNYLAIFSLILMGTLFVVTSCEEENDYDFSKIEPGRTAITGPALVYTGTAYEFKALTRGGSTYAWEKVSGDFTLTNEGHIATVLSNASANDVGVLKCTETTLGGIAGIPDTITFDISLFCAFDVNTFVGAYTCDEAGYGAYPVNLSVDPENANAVLNDNFWDWASPGEVIRYEFSGDFDQIVTVPLQDFVFGDGSAGTVEGSGTYNGCDGSMVVDYTVVSGGVEYDTHHEFTVGAPAKKSVLVKKGN